MRNRLDREYVSVFEALVNGKLNLYGYSLFPAIVFHLFDFASYMHEGVRDSDAKHLKGTKRRDPTNTIENVYLGQLLGGMQPLLDIAKEFRGFGNMRYKSYNEHAARDVIILFRAGLNVLIGLSSILLMPLLTMLTVVNTVLYSLTELFQGNFSEAGYTLLDGSAKATVNAAAYTLDGICRLTLALAQTGLTPVMFFKVPIYSAYTYFYGARPIEEDQVIKEVARDIQILSTHKNTTLSNGFLPSDRQGSVCYHDILVRLSKQITKAKKDGREISTLETLPDTVKSFMNNTQREYISDVLFYHHFLKKHHCKVSVHSQGNLGLTDKAARDELLKIANTLAPAAA